MSGVRLPSEITDKGRPSRNAWQAKRAFSSYKTVAGEPNNCSSLSEAVDHLYHLTQNKLKDKGDS